MSTRYVWGRYTRTTQTYPVYIYRAVESNIDTDSAWVDIDSSNGYQFYIGSGYRIQQSTGTLILTGYSNYVGGYGSNGKVFGSGYMDSYGESSGDLLGIYFIMELAGLNATKLAALDFILNQVEGQHKSQLSCIKIMKSNMFVVLLLVILHLLLARLTRTISGMEHTGMSILDKIVLTPLEFLFQMKLQVEQVLL